MSSRFQRQRVRIPEVSYAPPAHRYDIEVSRAWMTRSAASHPFLGAVERLGFWVLIVLESGRLHHIVDFEDVLLKPGYALLIRPGQVHQFILGQTWQGRMLLFRPEALPATTGARSALHEGDLTDQLSMLPAAIALPADTACVITAVLDQMAADSASSRAPARVAALLTAQLAGVLHRLEPADQAPSSTAPDDDARQRHRALRAAIDRHFLTLRDVGGYANLLGCSARTLHRVVAEQGSPPVKHLIDQRIALEAKRMLVHTDLPAAAIAEQLAFDEATNFGKFFKRTVGVPPQVFRDRYRKLT